MSMAAIVVQAFSGSALGYDRSLLYGLSVSTAAFLEFIPSLAI